MKVWGNNCIPSRVTNLVNNFWLVSIGSRLNQVVDESSSTGKALKDIYEQLGIALFDQEGQLRSSYDIFTDLAAIWNTLDKNTQNYIASQQAGKYLPIQSELTGTYLEPYTPNYNRNIIMAWLIIMVW